MGNYACPDEEQTRRASRIALAGVKGIVFQVHFCPGGQGLPDRLYRFFGQQIPTKLIVRLQGSVYYAGHSPALALSVA
jgi:hypothetical protein